MTESMCSRMQCAGYNVIQNQMLRKRERETEREREGLKFVSLLKLGGVAQRRKSILT